ncbi:hypothetical protein BAU08_23270 [Bordetella bronchialis]|uniref:RHS repeat-associated core domain-containing protein n=2 Tax=Bordetella bronchialis TaxID=463025 RepID=A0A193FM47_9BORD|nr:hypothetical protein BAU06_22720 [Bordetella bronchialis]ANN73884.1 hypothetical protein BAU08_23270 [Bordetella bronchialis]
MVQGYTGEWRDPVTGVMPLGNGYRIYLPGLMRFSAPDDSSPFAAGGINSYVYCAGDPINRSDPGGHSFLGLGSLWSAFASHVLKPVVKAYIDMMAAPGHFDVLKLLEQTLVTGLLAGAGIAMTIATVGTAGWMAVGMLILAVGGGLLAEGQVISGQFSGKGAQQAGKDMMYASFGTDAAEIALGGVEAISTIGDDVAEGTRAVGAAAAEAANAASKKTRTLAGNVWKFAKDSIFKAGTSVGMYYGMNALVKWVYPPMPEAEPTKSAPRHVPHSGVGLSLPATNSLLASNALPVSNALPASNAFPTSLSFSSGGNGRRPGYPPQYNALWG